MPRRIALRRMELGAGAAAAIIGLLTLPMALLAPLYPVCAVTSASEPNCAPIHYVSLLGAHPEGGVWALLLALLALTLAGAAGAITDARGPVATGARLVAGVGMLALWGATLVVFAICALGSRGPLGLLYLPSTLSLALAAYVALLRRLAARRAASHADDTVNAG
ncbi:MAG TPA: hypothetical protein VFN78_00945 [Ktedonobacterales bacterium]|nr:hypothetical protein [Ktedonobacterales bacterium]